MRRSWLNSLALVISWISVIPHAQGEGMCRALIQPIAHEVGVPAEILKATSFVESRDNPYALNHAGQSLSFTTPRQAWVYVEERLSHGEINIDIGCMQINWKNHQSQVADPRQLLVPSINIRYAAQFLKSLYAELGSWSKAVAVYHSRTKTKGQGYLIKVARVLREKTSAPIRPVVLPKTTGLMEEKLIAVTGQTAWQQKKRHIAKVSNLLLAGQWPRTLKNTYF